MENKNQKRRRQRTVPCLPHMDQYIRGTITSGNKKTTTYSVKIPGNTNYIASGTINEVATVGLGMYSYKKYRDIVDPELITENMFREQFGLNKRIYYVQYYAGYEIVEEALMNAL